MTGQTPDDHTNSPKTEQGLSFIWKAQAAPEPEPTPHGVGSLTSSWNSYIASTPPTMPTSKLHQVEDLGFQLRERSQLADVKQPSRVSAQGTLSADVMHPSHPHSRGRVQQGKGTKCANATGAGCSMCTPSNLHVVIGTLPATHPNSSPPIAARTATTST
mgnify:CR=1 FL=1